MVRSDVGGNINRIAKRQEEDPTHFKIIDAIVDNDVAKQDLGKFFMHKGAALAQQVSFSPE